MTKAATCEEKGEETYTAVFTNKAFKTQTKTVETDALGHLYGEVSYKWTKEDKGYSCTASRVCENDKNHVEKETVTAAYKVITKATSDKAGEGLYTATFKNAAFEEQSKKVKLVAADKKDNTTITASAPIATIPITTGLFSSPVLTAVDFLAVVFAAVFWVVVLLAVFFFVVVFFFVLSFLSAATSFTFFDSIPSLKTGDTVTIKNYWGDVKYKVVSKLL